MTTPRKELLNLLSELSETDGELRIGQMVANLATLAPALESKRFRTLRTKS